MSLVFRAYHAMLSSNLKNKAGEPTGAVFGFVNTLTSFLDRELPEHCMIVFDTEKPTFRHEMYDLYKKNRAEFPEELGPQLIKIKKFISILGVPQYELAGYEADDVIGTLAKMASSQSDLAFCITADKDYYQLVDENIKLMKPGKRGEDFDIVSFDEVREKFGVRPDQVIDVLSIVGDSSDNVPGVKGVGDKTAIPLVQTFGSLEAIYDNLDKIDKESLKTKLIDNKENAFLAKKLVTIDIHVPIDVGIDDTKIEIPNYRELDKFFEEQGFRQLRDKWKQRAKKDGIDDLRVPDGKIAEISEIKHDYKLVSKDELAKVIEYLSGFELLSFDLETDSLDRTTCEIVGVALSAKEGEAFYIPVAPPSDSKKEKFSGSLFDVQEPTIESNDSLIEFEIVIKLLKPLLESQNIGKCGQNIKFDSFILRRYGVNPSPLVFDTMVADYLINPDGRHNLDVLSERWLNYKPIPISQLIGEKKSKQITMREVEPKTVAEYAGEDADLALKLTNILIKEISKLSMNRLADEIEFPLLEVLTDMELAGVCLDKNALKESSIEIGKMIDSVRKEIIDLAGEEFNIDSPKQLGFILFDKLQIQGGKKTKTGYSTDVQVLTELAPYYPIADKIISYRQLVKLKSTYLDALPLLISPATGRIHTTYNQTIASTGRLSSTDPNLQNIPIRTENGREIRKAFIPSSSEHVLISADYSQIELRVMAFICNDENLINAFIEGKDIHSATASILFNVPIEEVDSNQRRTAKTVNFGILYGLGSFGLSQRLGIGRKEASEIINNYFAKYPTIRNYINSTIELTRKQGYIETLCGRRRYFPDINSNNNNIRTAAERAAINMPIQGTASDMIKIAMIRIFRRLEREQLKTRMIMQVHDELVFDSPKSEIATAQQIIKEEMTSALPLGRVPVAVEIGYGSNWLEAH